MGFEGYLNAERKGYQISEFRFLTDIIKKKKTILLKFRLSSANQKAFNL